MYKKEVPKLNRENFPTWQSLMKIHITSIRDTTWTSVGTGYTTPTRTLSTKQLRARKEHNQAILEIYFTLTY